MRGILLLVGILLVLVLAACSSPDETEQPEAAQPSPETTELISTIPAPTPEEEPGDSSSQEEAYQQISKDVGFEPELIKDMGLARFIAPYLPASSDDPETAARSYFETYAGLYGVEALDQSLRLTQLQELNSGSLVRFQQYLEDLPVYAGQAIVSISGDGLIAFVNTALLPTTSISRKPAIDSQAAVQSAVDSSGDAEAETAREPQLMLFSPQVMAIDETDPSLVWEVGLLVADEGGGPAVLIQYLVDAANGDILLEVPEHLSAENWVVSSSQNSDDIVKWYEMSQGTLSVEVDGSGERLADEEGEAAQNNIDETWDYFFNTHGWDGHDNNGGQCNITVRVGTDWENATCGADCNCKFGDGVGDWAAFLDVLAHEFTHAVVGQTAGLNYLYQSGAINEHYADFFAAMVETSDWLNSNPKGFRNLSDPPNGSYESPDHYGEMIPVDIPARGNDYGWVHFNSGIPNKAAFMVGDTGSNTHPDSGIDVQGLGRLVTEQIWFNTLLGLGSSTSLVQWASSTVGTTYSFVPDTITEEQACEVQYAMQAVGLREPDCRCDDTEVCPIMGLGGQSSDGGVDEPTGSVVTACAHPYFPVYPGSRWTYADNEGNSVEYIVQEVIGDEQYAEAKVEGFIEGGGLSVTMGHIWTCDQEGIKAPLTSVTGLSQGIETTVVAQDDGVFLPPLSGLDFGTKWSYETIIDMEILSPDTGPIPMNVHREEEYTSEKMTDVTVQAGSFSALEISGEYSITSTFSGFSDDFTGKEVLWFAEGVGMVKNTVEQDGTYTLELVDYFIPGP